MEKILTISVAAYNVAKYLEKTLDSIVESKEILEALEIIIVNDGSIDKTLEIAQRYEKKYPNTVKVIDKANAGYGSTINASIKSAKGKYYRLLDGDDWFETENLPQYVESLREHDEDMIVTPYKKVDELTGNIEEIFKNTRLYKENTIEKLQDNHICMHEISVKTENIRRICITENCFYTDNEYVVDVILHSKTVAYLDTLIYCYRVGNVEQSVGIEGIRKHYQDLMKVTYNTGKKVENTKITNNITINRKIQVMMWTVFIYFSLVETYTTLKKSFVGFDIKIKMELPSIYHITMQNKHIRDLRRSRYVLLLPMYLVIKLKQRNSMR